MHKSATGGKEKIMIIKTMIITSNIFRKIKFLQFETKKEVFLCKIQQQKTKQPFQINCICFFTFLKGSNQKIPSQMFGKSSHYPPFGNSVDGT